MTQVTSDAGEFETHVIPQADDLDTVRAVLEAVVAGAVSRPAIAEATRFALRHANYRLRAALLLGLAEEGDDGLAVTAAGKRLLALPARSDDERRLLRELFCTVPALSDVAPDLLASVPPRRNELARRIERATRMARSTAVRRAGTLLSWRRRMMPRQLSLFDELD